MMNKNSIKTWLGKHDRLKKIIVGFYNSVSNLLIGMVLILQNLLLFPFLRHPQYNKKYKISICGIFKNEAPFLKEWLEFHEMIGVEHFFLYNNNSEDDYQTVLNPYLERGLVTLIDWPYNQAQMAAYKHFYDTFRHDTQWVSFLDIDEFFCPRYETSLTDWLMKNDKYPVLLIYWRMFGTSAHLHHNPDKLLIEQYTVSWEKLYHVGKCLINTDYDITVFDSTTHHQTLVKYPLIGRCFKITVRPVNQFGWFVYDPFHFGWFYNEKKNPIQINHYWSKAWDIYDKKRQMTDVFFKENPKKNLSYFLWHENQNCSTNHIIFRFVMQLKLKMDNNN